MKKIFISLVIGAVVGGWFGINYGRGQSWWQNPFADKIEQAKEAVHEATKPAKDAISR